MGCHSRRIIAYVIANRFILAILGQPKHCREASDFKAAGNIVSGSIHLDDGNIFILQNAGNFLKDRSQLLAVATPWSIEFNECILAVVGDDFIEVFSNCGFQRRVVLWDRFGLQKRFSFAILDVIQELLEGFNSAKK